MSPIISSYLGYNWQEISALLTENDGAIFIAYPERFSTNVSALKIAFERYYPRLGLGYSYKTNHLPKLCISANEQGMYAEVVSGTEFDIALKLGVDGGKIIFNGPTKTQSELLKAFAHGALVNVDSLSEAEQIARLSKEHTTTIRLGLRCNLDLNWKSRQSRFGLSETSGELDEAWSLLTACKNIRIEGLHCHTSFDRSAESYTRRILRLIEIADRLFGAEGPQFLDIGGGLAGPMSNKLRQQFAIPPPTYEEYAEAIGAPMMERYGDNGPELILEPGVGLIGNVFEYAFRVEHLKQIGDKWFAVTNGASHHIKIVPNDFNLPTRLIGSPEALQSERKGDEIDIAGYTCLEHDIIFRSFEGPLARGDILVTENIGAYSMVSSPDFIRTNPPVYEKVADSWKQLRKKQSVDTFLNEFIW